LSEISSGAWLAVAARLLSLKPTTMEGPQVAVEGIDLGAKAERRQSECSK
jgi:hypothetical protein